LVLRSSNKFVSAKYTEVHNNYPSCRRPTISGRLPGYNSYIRFQL